jgi:hypothetical protein
MATCARCGNEAAGYATIGEDRYCHGDNEQPTCYMRASWERSAEGFKAVLTDARLSRRHG